MREEAVIAFLEKAGKKWVVIDRLIKDGSLMEVKYQGKKFYMRKLPQRNRRPLHAT